MRKVFNPVPNRLAALAAMMTLLCSSAFSQSISGDLAGAIFDPTGGTIAGAAVTVKNVDTGVESSTKSTGAGQYHISNLPAGTYNVVVSATGFSTASVKGVAVELNQIGTANVTLQVGSTATTVEVSEAPPSVDTSSAQISTTFDSTQMADLPSASSGSGIINLSLLTAGVSSSGGTGLGTGPSVGGQRPRNNNFTIEGIDNNSGSVTGPVVTIPNDAVAEFTLLQNQFSADFGHSSGGQFNQVVKSGTNMYHGSAYIYNENRNYDASDTLSATNGTPLHPRFDSNRFGGTAGGPIKKNKLFFFADYEYTPTGSVGTAGLLYGPTAAG
jgi:carboxypeptidase family protein